MNLSPKTTFLFALFLSTLSSLAQTAPGSDRAVLKSGEESWRGVVIETVARNSEAERAGLQEGDMVLSWSRGDSHGEILSPFDFGRVEVEQKPRGTVILEGFRGAAKRTWTLRPDDWGTDVRPDFVEPRLSVYVTALKLAKASKMAEAHERWQAVARAADASQAVWIRSWVWFHVAKLLTDARQWKESDGAYQEAIQEGAQLTAEVRSQLLQGWARSFEQRSDYPNAKKQYERALAAAQTSAVESLLSAGALNHLGTLAMNTGDLAKAEECHRQALAMQEHLAPASLSVATSLNGLGYVFDYRGDLPKAEDYHLQALAIQENLAPGGLAVAASFIGLGSVAYYRGDLAKAEEYFGRALGIREALVPDSIMMSGNLIGLGNVSLERGDLAKAEKYFTRALAISEKQESGLHAAAGCLRNLGLVATRRGNLVEAEAFTRRALEIERKLAPDSVDFAATLNNLGDTLEERGDLAGAEKCIRQALAITEKLAPGGASNAINLENLGSALRERGDMQGAELYHRKALEIQEKRAPISFHVAQSLFNLGIDAMRRGDLAEAEEYQHKALAIQEKVAPGGLDYADTLDSLGAIALGRGGLAEAETWYRQALTIREKLASGSTVHAESLAALATVMHRLHNADAAMQLFGKALTMLESQTVHLGGTDDIRSGFRARHQGYYNDYVDLLITQNEPELAFEVLERSRARTLLETLATAHVDLRKGADPELLAKERSLRADIRAKSDRRVHLMGDQHGDEQIKAVEKEVSALTTEYQDVEARIRSSSPVYTGLTQPKPLSLREVQRLLDADTLLLEYEIGEEHSYLFAVSATSLTVHELPKRSQIEEVARPVYELLTAQNRQVKETAVQRALRLKRAEAQYPEAARKLSQMLLGPEASQLKARRLLIAGDGILQYVPFAALPSVGAEDRDQHSFVPLIVEHEIVSTPSASILQVLREGSAANKTPKKTIAVLADPVFAASDARVQKSRKAATPMARNQPEQSGAYWVETSDSVSNGLLRRSAAEVGLANGTVPFPRLIFTRREADTILQQVVPDQRMVALDFEASRATALSSDLARYRIVHFATHGLLNSEHPELSGLVFSLVDAHGKKQDGFLTLTDIYNLNLPADLIVLSACETALGKEVQGEGLVGLTRGFMYAGASRVVASVWKVDDAATAEMMGKFYSGILKDHLPPAAALKRAQVQMWKQKRWSSPFYWAGFVMQGEW
jgi:CHAT domain-containing protein/Tfp pilus assembly protein PilF